MKVTYSSNNSGGSWWLSDQNWIDLETAGWTVEWGGNMWEADHKKIIPPDDPRRPKSASDVKVRYLGALATSAWIESESPAAAIQNWEAVTGQRAGEDGCNCCGPPHTFQWKDGDSSEYLSGEDIADYLARSTADPFELLAYEKLRKKLGL